ncbi:MAG: hypothetical protein HY699_01560 [Deltaproteobacteria bacterium]|nr:hypothetical protein [Deltaproteobacteria bacterium]
MARAKTAGIPRHFRTAEAAGRFWDTHDLADYWDQTEPASVSFHLQRQSHLFAVEPRPARELHAVAAARGVSPETIANPWLRERLAHESGARRRRAKPRAAA